MKKNVKGNRREILGKRKTPDFKRGEGGGFGKMNI